LGGWNEGSEALLLRYGVIVEWKDDSGGMTRWGKVSRFWRNWLRNNHIHNLEAGVPRINPWPVGVGKNGFEPDAVLADFCETLGRASNAANRLNVGICEELWPVVRER